jgi:hypothetical protein
VTLAELIADAKHTIRPGDAVGMIVDERRGPTTAEIAAALRVHGYEWPGRGFTRPTYERVAATLRRLEHGGIVERVPLTGGSGNNPIRWRRPRG